MNPALKVYAHILKDNDHPDRFKVAKNILDRNKLLGTGTPEESRTGNHLTVNTQLNTNVAAMSDPDLAAYRQLISELRELLPSEELKALPGVAGR